MKKNHNDPRIQKLKCAYFPKIMTMRFLQNVELVCSNFQKPK